MKRCDIDNIYKWDLSDIYENHEDFLADQAKLSLLFLKFESFKGHLLDDVTTLKKFFELSHETEAILEKMEVYSYCLHDVELENKEYIEVLDKSENLITLYNQVTSYVVPEILKSDLDTVLALIAEDEYLSKLERFFKEMFRNKKCVLSESEERILSSLNLVAEGYAKASTFITDKEVDYGFITVDGKEVKLLASNIPKYIRHKNRDIRKATFESERDALKRHNDSLATNLISFIKASEQEARVRKFDNYLEEKFFGEDLDVQVYDTLKTSVQKYKDAYKLYENLFKRELKLDSISSYDMNAPLFDNSSKEYSVLEAKEIILKTFSLFGENYLKVLNHAFNDRCIDYLPCLNKTTGWYSIYTPFTTPKVFANFEGKILDISSLAHELGHFCNQYMSVKENICEYATQSTFCAEVASLTNEIIFSQTYKPENKEDEAQLLFNFVKTFASNFFGASRQALFEEKIHMMVSNGDALSSDTLNQIWMQVALDIYGDDLLDYSPYSWSAIPHFFLGRGYYVYNYATAIVAATNVASKILSKEEGFLDKYIEFLKIGSKMRPQDCLGILGIDMTDEKTYDVAISLFTDALNRLENI